MKKLLLIVLIIFMVFNCSQKENQIQMAKEHIEKIGKNATTRDINEMYDNGKIYYENKKIKNVYEETILKMDNSLELSEKVEVKGKKRE